MLAAAGVAWFALGQTQWIDDSFISFRYSRHLLEGHGLVYNPGEAVEGYTNYLWCITIWLGMKLGADPIAFTQGLSLLMQALTLMLVYRLGCASLGSARKALIAPALLTMQIGFCAYPMTGMESTSFAFFATLSFFLLHTGAHSHGRGKCLLALSLCALALTRFDGFVLTGIVFCFPLLVKRDWRRLAAPLIVLALTWAAYNAWRVSTYPTLLPNSFHAKIHFTPYRIIQGLSYVWEFFEPRGLILALGLLPLALGRISSLGRYLFWVVGFQLTYTAIVGGDWMPHSRFIYHVLPLVLLLVQEGTWNLWGYIEPKLSSSAGPRKGAMLGLLMILMGSSALPFYEDIQTARKPDQQFFDPHQAREIGEALDDIVPQGLLIAIEWGGIIPFYTHRNVLDTFGITDVEISHSDIHRTIWGRWVDHKYIASRNPDLVVFCARVFESSSAALRSTRGKGHCNYKDFLQLNNPKLGYKLRIFELSPGRFWPALVKMDGPLAK